jgi:hypothetical protein
MLLQPILPQAALQTMVAMVFVAGLFVGIGSRGNVAKTFQAGSPCEPLRS